MSEDKTLVEQLRDDVAFLATQPLAMDLGQWSVMSNRILGCADRLEAQAAEIARLREALGDIYWEAMNLGSSHKWLASNDGEIDGYSPAYTVSQVMHEFARKTIKTAAQTNGVELYR